MGRHPDTAFMVENMVVNSVVAGDAAVQSRLLGAEFEELTPTELEWPQSRTRRIAQNVVSNLGQLKRKVPFDPNVRLAPLGYRTDATVVPCVMASLDTHAQMKLWDVRTERQVKHVVEVAEVMQGYQPGISSAWGVSDAPVRVRQQMVGNAFHASFVQSILRNWQPVHLEERTRRIMAMTKEDMEDEMLEGVQTSLEKRLKRMSDVQLSDWMDEKMVGYKELRLSLDVEDGEASA